MQRLENVCILDVRTEAEHQEGHIPNSVNIDIYKPDFTSRIEQLDPDRPYLVYCKAGGRSANAMRLMQSLGFDNVAHLAGGYTAWAVHERESQGQAE